MSPAAAAALAADPHPAEDAAAAAELAWTAQHRWVEPLEDVLRVSEA